MKRIILTLATLALLTGCAELLIGCAELQTIKKAYTVVTEATVPASAVTAAGNAFIIAENAGTAYLTFCDGKPADPRCSADAERLVISYTRKGRAALNQLKTQIRSSPTASASIYNVLITALNTIDSTPASNFGASQ